MISVRSSFKENTFSATEMVPVKSIVQLTNFSNVGTIAVDHMTKSTKDDLIQVEKEIIW